MKIKKVIVSMLVFTMVFGVGSVKAQAETQANKIAELQSITDANKVFDTEAIEKKWDQVSKNVVIKQDMKNKAAARTSLARSLSDVSTKSSGTYPTRKGVILVTGDKYKGIIPLGHAAIIYSAAYVVESVSEGVVVGRNNWNTTRETCYGVTVNGTTASQDAQAANYCYQQLNKPYNFNYYDMGTRGKFYCSHLVWSSFKDLFGIDMNTSAYDIRIGSIVIATAIHPLEIVDTNKTYTIYVK
ncbi:MAG: YiiX/YebB-like N1pC/P60 family cysteine hydrolase [Herbinix sp.]|nr:YiiX/YebB-like N1pC/P60 family cysteine hydrolase [Herbinix sp.]